MTTAKPVTLALQGGGAHGAFTWGVLDQILADGRLNVTGISGTSAGAMNGVMLAEGLAQPGDGAANARAALARFWAAIAKLGRFAPFGRTPFDTFVPSWNLDAMPGYRLFEAVSRYLSPYQFNPLNLNPLLETVREQVDFDSVRKCEQAKLFVSATNVRTGKIKVFDKDDVTAEAIMASAALPHVFQAVEIDGEPYWDGGYMGNPPIFPLIYNCDTPDVLVVQINPLVRDEVPTDMSAIDDRLNEITFNATLMREMRAIAFVTKLLDEGRIESTHYRRMYMHRIDVAEEMRHLTAASKMNAEWDFLTYLRDLGRREAARWLDQHFDAIGQRSTVDIHDDYL